MSVQYKAVLWNRQKKIYDRVLAAAVAGYLAVFVGGGAIFFPQATAETLIIRAFGTAAFILLNVILSIGPLSRIDARFLPLLYNRRHLGVTMFLLALVHGVFSIIQFHTLGDLNPLVSLLAGNTDTSSLSSFPFQPLGLAALAILFVMAATSHDFWLANLTAPVWKALHMLVYLAYGLLLMHISLGVLQAETHPVYAVLLASSALWIFLIHAVAAWREKGIDQINLAGRNKASEQWVAVCKISDIPENRAFVACLSGERIAVFRYSGRVSAISNVCQHQNGPLGEGCIIDGLVTCPWHGYQYRPESGASPEPFTEKIPTFRVQINGDTVYVDPRPNPPGTYTEPAMISADEPGGEENA